MTNLRGRKIHRVEIDDPGDGSGGGGLRNAYATSIDHLLTIDDLMHAIAAAATSPKAPDGRRFEGALGHNRVADETYWSEADTSAARSVAAAIGPGTIYKAARDGLRAYGESWRSNDWQDVFPPDVARSRAEELFPMLRDGDANPFAPARPLTDR